MFEFYISFQVQKMYTTSWNFLAQFIMQNICKWSTYFLVKDRAKHLVAFPLPVLYTFLMEITWHFPTTQHLVFIDISQPPNTWYLLDVSQSPNIWYLLDISQPPNTWYLTFTYHPTFSIYLTFLNHPHLVFTWRFPNTLHRKYTIETEVKEWRNR